MCNHNHQLCLGGTKQNTDCNKWQLIWHSFNHAKHYHSSFITNHYFMSIHTVLMEVGEKNFVHSYQRCYGDTIGKNSQIAYFCKLCCSLLLFQKYVGICHFLCTWVWQNHIFHGTRVHEIWVSYKKFSGKFEVYFFKKLEFLELEFHGKLEFQKCDRFLNISNIVVDW